MPKSLDIPDYLLQNPGLAIPLIDVRSPGEFSKGHIPGAINIPLFTNEERAIVGTTYKQKGRKEAILTGLELIGPQISKLASRALEIIPEKRVFVHCWRGGMRSGAFAQLLETFGIEVYTLKGGYKSYRKWALEQCSKSLSIKVLGGFTGSGKTQILHHLSDMGIQILDLEKRARHLGSVFGTLGTMEQPSQEQFENDLAYDISLLDPGKTVWLEDESRTLGKIGIPGGLWEQMRTTLLYKLEIPAERRKNHIREDYQDISPEFVESCIHKISARLGGLETKNALEALGRGDKEKIIDIMLQYYDRTYSGGQKKREAEKIMELEFREESFLEIAKKLSQIE